MPLLRSLRGSCPRRELQVEVDAYATAGYEFGVLPNSHLLATSSIA
jgi:hypothetical protein